MVLSAPSNRDTRDKCVGRCPKSLLKISVAGGAGMKLDVADVGNAGEVHDQTLEAQTVACVAAGAVAAKIEVPPVVVGVQTQLVHACKQNVEALLALRAADDLADAGNKAVGRGNGLAVVVCAHVKRLDILGVIGDEDGLFKDLLGQIALVLGLQVDAPLNGEVELLVAFLEDIDGLGVAYAAELVGNDVLEALEQTLVHEGVEKLHLLWAALDDGVYDVLDHRLGVVHVVVKVCKCHLGLDHPELGGVALSVGYLGAEGRAEGVNIAEGHGEVFGVELAGNGKARDLAEEILAVIDLAVLAQREVVQVEGGHAEHLACALAVGAGDDRRVDVYKAVAAEKFVHCLRRNAADAEGCREQVRARSQVLDSAQELDAVALFLKRIVGGGCALDGDLGRLQLKRLLRVGREHKLALGDERRADVLMRKLVVVIELLALEHDLQALEARAVVKLDKAEILHVADGARPAADGYLLAAEAVRIGKYLSDLSAFHNNTPIFCFVC